MKNLFNNTLLTLLVLLTSISVGQTKISGGADFVSRYVWRGLDFGNSFSIQPSLILTSGSFEAGFWGSYPFVNTANGNEEIDLFLAYSLSNFSIVVTDYYFPNSGLKLGMYDDPGAHTVEVGLSYGGTDSFPISLAAFMNLYNDDDNTIYFELGYSTEVSEVTLDFFVGGTPGGRNNYYSTTEFSLINIGIIVSKDIKITDAFSLPIFSSYVVNPNMEVGYLLFGFSLGM